jgi:zinc finger protein
MATNCYACGYRDNEIKSGGAVSEKGRKITLKVGDEEDMSRDMLKVSYSTPPFGRNQADTQSDTAGLEIPEIDLVLQPGTLGGRFTTLEGLLNEIYNELSTKVFRTGDSATSGVGQAGLDTNSDERTFESFLQGLKKCMAAEIKFTLIIDDPVSNSYVQNLYAPDPDPNMVIEEYVRSYEQNEDLGLNDIVVEGYEEQEEKDKAERDAAAAAPAAETTEAPAVEKTEA